MATDLDDLIRNADPARDLPIPEPDPSAARAEFARRPHRRWTPIAGLLGTGLAVLIAVAVVVIVVAVAGHRKRRATSAPAVSPTTGAVATPGTACRPEVHNDVLPEWARGGFSDPRPQVPHVLGASGDITAILFANPLLSPPPKNRNNKILWVSRVAVKPGSNLRITAQRMIGSRRVGSPVARQVIGGPGPSIINLASPGCWRLTLQWSGWTDTLDLRYRAPD